MFVTTHPGEIEPHMGQDIVLRNSLTIPVDTAEIGLCGRLSLFGGAPEPYQRLRIILRDTSALIVHGTEIILRGHVSGFGGAAIPFHCLGIILRDALTLGVHEAENALCANVSAFSSAAIPFRRFGIVLRHALAVVVHMAEIELRSRIALFGSAAIPFRRFGIVLRYPQAHVIHAAEIELRIHESGFSRHPAGNESSYGRQTSLEAVRTINVFRRNGTDPHTGPQQGDTDEKPKNRSHDDAFSFFTALPDRVLRKLRCDLGGKQLDVFEELVLWFETVVGDQGKILERNLFIHLGHLAFDIIDCAGHDQPRVEHPLQQGPTAFAE